MKNWIMLSASKKRFIYWKWYFTIFKILFASTLCKHFRVKLIEPVTQMCGIMNLCVCVTNDPSFITYWKTERPHFFQKLDDKRRYNWWNLKGKQSRKTCFLRNQISLTTSLSCFVSFLNSILVVFELIKRLVAKFSGKHR